MKIILFDWGDTLMIDFPSASGKMCDWETVRAINGAEETLQYLCHHCDIYVATNAAESSVEDIERAFVRVGLAKYIEGYFCKANLGVGKGTPLFYSTILNKLNLSAQQVTMVGDNRPNDIIPALEAGLDAIWFNPTSVPQDDEVPTKQIGKLTELCRLFRD